MAVYVVSWNLNKERSNYNSARAEFLKQFDKYQTKSDSGLESTRFVSTNESANAVSEHLLKKMDTNDRLIVSRMRTGEHQGWLQKDVWDWINARI